VVFQGFPVGAEGVSNRQALDAETLTVLSVV
jgi:hypothetical protein